jgi:hypothetical protein
VKRCRREATALDHLDEDIQTGNTIHRTGSLRHVRASTRINAKCTVDVARFLLAANCRGGRRTAYPTQDYLFCVMDTQISSRDILGIQVSVVSEVD